MIDPILKIIYVRALDGVNMIVVDKDGHRTEFHHNDLADIVRTDRGAVWPIKHDGQLTLIPVREVNKFLQKYIV